MKFDKEIQFLIKHRDKIPAEFWSYPRAYYSGECNPNIDDFVCWFMDRQKPSVVRDYSFDEERFGMTRKGEIIWGFDSGCSCPTPWEDGNEYKTTTWKQFKVSPETAFDADWEDACYTKMQKIICQVQANISPKPCRKSTRQSRK